ncbi:hypothetical protein [Endozoicomonas euniceicola]|uniref:Holin of 3TMs, for gene-transfer release n=1 Tax=Endozoicomonas euniceicola TaxID=1234143 RepID=A0ABY6GNG2_9GAMM|nr:hypothetical protein [Endozoicomonas euniceicola]UYM14270.1 hypothetical protein NX720_15335 [Endozoicomonas euniceicola]
MNWNIVKDLLAKSAPLVGTALGGPAGAAMGAMVANALGVESEPVAVARAIQQDPEALVKLKQFELENEQQVRELAFKTLQVELADKANARQTHKDSRMPAVITLLMTTIVGALLMALFNTELPEGNKEVAYMLFGQAVTLWGASITYWVGTTRGSSDKSKQLSQAGVGSSRAKCGGWEWSRDFQ